MSQAHVDAVLSRLRAHTGLAAVVFEPGVVPTAPRPGKYVVLYANAGEHRATRMTGPHEQRRIRFWCHWVGVTHEQARWVAERGIGQLLDWTPTVAGWSCWRLRPVSSQPVQVDDDVRPVLFFGVDEFELTTTRNP